MSPRKVATTDDLLKKKPRTAEVQLLLDDDLVLEHDRAVDELRTARANGHKPADVKAIEKRVAQLEEAVHDATRVLRFQAIGGKRYDELIKDHPPTDEQVRDFRKSLTDELQQQFPGVRPDFNADTFPVALIAVSCVDPQLTPEEVEQLRDELNAGEFGALRLAAFDVNTAARTIG